MRLMAMAVMLCGAHQLGAQERKVQNRPYIDMRRWHYGFLIGTHFQDIEFTNNASIHTTEEGTQEAWFADVASYTPGFSVGVLGELRMTEHVALRFVPTMHFGDKAVTFREQQSGAMEWQAIKSTYLTVPVEVKYSAQRFNNYRPYVLAGLAPMLDLTVKRQRALLVQRADVAVEVGLGCDFYLPFFKLIPELKFCFGLSDILVKDRSDLTDKNLLKYTQALDKATSRMMVLTFYFE
ncbi:MAG: PorT family protein [Bacteroidaceae bacterium]|nr:PorT family protein [Bacteroidaceae bacterium]